MFKNIHSDRYRREQGDLGEIVTSEDEADEWIEKHVELPKYDTISILGCSPKSKIVHQNVNKTNECKQ